MVRKVKGVAARQKPKAEARTEGRRREGDGATATKLSAAFDSRGFLGYFERLDIGREGPNGMVPPGTPAPYERQSALSSVLRARDWPLLRSFHVPLSRSESAIVAAVWAFRSPTAQAYEIWGGHDASGHAWPMRTQRLSEYGVRACEKQRMKAHYSVLEKQFRRYMAAAKKAKGNTAVTLQQLLETRLDNVVRRLGVVRSIWAARQLVSHGHVKLNGKKVDIPFVCGDAQ